jgi:hypothetical protein
LGVVLVDEFDFQRLLRPQLHPLLALHHPHGDEWVTLVVEKETIRIEVLEQCRLGATDR